MPKVTTSTIRKLLTDELRLKGPEFFLSTGPAGRINGHVVSTTFKGMRDRQRQGMLWDALEFVLGRSESRKAVGMLIAYTPEEWYADELSVPTVKLKRKKAG